MIRTTRIILASACALALASTAARADIVTALSSTTQNANGSYSYTYTATLTGQAQLIGTATSGSDGVSGANQFGTVYDFGQIISTNGVMYTATGLLSNTFAFTFNNTDTPPMKTSPTDSPALTNIRFSYLPTNTLTYLEGGMFSAPAGTAAYQTVAVATANLGTFTVISPFAPTATANIQYDGVSYKGTNDTQQQNLGLTNGPSLATAVPEPASMALLGAGLMGAGFIRRRRSNTAA